VNTALTAQTALLKLGCLFLAAASQRSHPDRDQQQTEIQADRGRVVIKMQASRGI